MSQHLSCFLYHSQLAPGVPISCVADIVKTARSLNRQHAITGMLIFDGMRFAQYIEGPQQAIQSLVDKLGCDGRHHGVVTQWHAPLAQQRRFADWAMAYALVDEQDPIDDLTRLQAQAALLHFMQMQPLLDIA